MVGNYDIRLRQFIQSFFGRRLLMPPLEHQDHDRIGLKTDGAAGLTPEGALTVNAGPGLATVGGSPKQLVPDTDETLSIRNGKLHAQPSTEDIRNVTFRLPDGTPQSTLADVLQFVDDRQTQIVQVQTFNTEQIQIAEAARDTSFAEEVAVSITGVGTSGAELNWRELR